MKVTPYIAAWCQEHPDGPERRRYQRVLALLTPIAHIGEDTYHAGVLAALEAWAGRIHTGYDNDGEKTYLEFTPITED